MFLFFFSLYCSLAVCVICQFILFLPNVSVHHLWSVSKKKKKLLVFLPFVQGGLSMFIPTLAWSSKFRSFSHNIVYFFLCCLCTWEFFLPKFFLLFKGSWRPFLLFGHPCQVGPSGRGVPVFACFSQWQPLLFYLTM